MVLDIHNIICLAQTKPRLKPRKQKTNYHPCVPTNVTASPFTRMLGQHITRLVLFLGAMLVPKYTYTFHLVQL